MPADDPKPFDPLNKLNLGGSVARELLFRPVEPLPPAPFTGAGVYAIYYTGEHQPFEVYAPIATHGQEPELAVPIYVGKAVPEGARKGGFGLDVNPGSVLFNRLKEHGSSVAQAENLDARDFRCRYLRVDDIWIPLSEVMLIQMFSPIWNRVLDGYGNHDPGTRRATQYKSLWDTLHPGRPWANKLAPNPVTTEQIIERLRQGLAERAQKDQTNEQPSGEDS
jgi:hypothetical protein